MIRGLEVLKRHGVDWNVLTTIHAANGDQGARVYRFLRDDLGAEFIQFIPIIERTTAEMLSIANEGWGDNVKGRPLYTQNGDLVTDRSVAPEQYGRFLIDVFEEWVRRDIGSVYVQMFDTALANWVGEGGGMCVHAETCGLQLAIEHNGDLYSCDHFVEPDYLLGNIKEQHMLTMVASQQQRQFGEDKRDTLTQFCLDCDVRFACNGGCPKDRFAVSPYGEPGQHYLCPGYKLFFHHVERPMRLMAELLAEDRAPSELMGVGRRRGRAARPQRPLHLRLGPQVEAVPRRLTRGALGYCFRRGASSAREIGTLPNADDGTSHTRGVDEAATPQTLEALLAAAAAASSVARR